MRCVVVSLLLALLPALLNAEGDTSAFLPRMSTLLGTDNSTTRTAGRFGKGSEEHGHTIPAVLEPHGMTFWTPQTQATELKCICPYYYKDTLLQGFRASHWVVGGCTQDYGSFTLMPATSHEHLQPEARAVPFSHDEETATPAYYRVQLPDVDCEMTGRSRSAIFRFRFRDKQHAYLILQTNSDEGQGDIQYLPDRCQVRASNPVHRIYQGWGEEAGMVGYALLQLPMGSVCQWGHEGQILWLRLSTESIVVKMGTSFVSADGAERNLRAEISHWDFDRTRHELEAIWQQQFSKIEVKGKHSLFYSSLYHASFLPHVLNDVDGHYPGFAGSGIKQLPPGRNYYDDFSAWDTYRAQHPLLNIISPHESGDMMQSLVLKFQQGGWLPIFPCWNSYTAAMIGDHCAALLAEAYVKGIRNFDYETAYEGMRKNAFETPLSIEEYRNGMGRRALDSYLRYGYIPLEDSVPDAFHQREQTSRTMEYAYDDYAVAQQALLLGHTEDYHVLTQRSHSWTNVINPQTGWCDGRTAGRAFSNEAFPMSDVRPDRRPTFLTEGWPCHYTWYVPHDVEGLIQFLGGRERFVSRLDSIFTEGLYWHGNEPCHQMAYLFDYAGQPWRTQHWVRHILRTEYNESPGGLSGNDDAGQMSAWYIFSSLGFYPVCPVSGWYAIGSPIFQEVSIPLASGRVFRIIAHNASEENIYIQWGRKNGEPMSSPFFTHDDLLSGCTLEFEMGPKPSSWGCTKEMVSAP